ncbi:MAG: GAF domain-containing protein [Chloroflexi bacterium]|nr:GAF domain-containing protein [Chloroflexota bacterium]
MSTIASIYILNSSLLLMIAAVVYASFELTPKQPDLMVRLIGLSLVTFLLIFSAFGLYEINAAIVQVDESNLRDVDMVKNAIPGGNFTSVSASISYILTLPVAEGAAGNLMYASDAKFTPQFLFDSQREDVVDSPFWEYVLEAFLRNENRAGNLRYGNNLPGTYHQYVGYIDSVGDIRYEVGFDLAEMSRVIFRDSVSMIYVIALGSLAILAIFPFFFRANLARPLDRLLTGVRQADAGNLDVSVPVEQSDEIGFLTEAFNNMTASLREELAKRKQAEKELREVNISLEQRIASRTRELSALYDVSAAASQALDSETLLNESLIRTMQAVQSSAGAIFLFEPPEADTEFHAVRLVAENDLPVDWLSHSNTLLAALSAKNGLFDTILSRREPLLIPDLTKDPRVPELLRLFTPTAMLMAPLQAEGKILGVIGLVRQLGQSFDLDEVALLAAIADQVGIAVQNDLLRQQAQQVSVLEERQRLARDLHDSVTQSLYGLATLTEAGQVRLEKNDQKAASYTFARIGQTARQAIREMRLFIHQLRPPVLEQEGLIGALDLRLAAVEGRSDLDVHLNAENDIALSTAQEAALYHIAKEALNNTLKHAGADSVSVNVFRQNQQIILEICDNGKGFNTHQENIGGMGLVNMKQRAEAMGGDLIIESSLGSGTRVIALLEIGRGE